MNNKISKSTRISRKERIANDFLIQLTYTIIASIVLLFIYNGAMMKYGSFVAIGIPTFLWILTGIGAIGGGLFLYNGIKKEKAKFKDISYYFFATGLFGFFVIGTRTICHYLSKLFTEGSGIYNFLRYFANDARLYKILFILLAVSVIVELAVYFYRMNRVTKPVKHSTPKKVKNN